MCCAKSGSAGRVTEGTGSWNSEVEDGSVVSWNATDDGEAGAESRRLIACMSRWI